ncbi:MAG: hypothetical protein RH946_03410 [Rhodospirillales bacterium]
MNKKFGLWVFALAFSLAIPFGKFASTSERDEVTFGLTKLGIPKPEGHCKIEESEGRASILLDWQKEGQFKIGNKLLAFWVDCAWLGDFNSGLESELSKWMIIVAGLSGPEKREQVFPKLSRKSYIEYMLKQSGQFTDKHHTEAFNKSANEALREANKKFLSNRDAVKSGELIPLGVLGVSDSIHVGYIQSVEGQTGNILVGSVFSSTLVHGAVVHTYFYEEYENEGTIQELLHEAKTYSAKFIVSNK